MPTLADSGSNPASRRDVAELIRNAVKELQSLQVSVVNGAAAATNIAVTGLDTDDVIVAVLYFPISGGNVTSVSNLVSEASAPTNGNLQLSTTVTTGGKLAVVFYSATAGA